MIVGNSRYGEPSQRRSDIIDSNAYAKAKEENDSMAGLTAEETTWLEQYKHALAERFPGLVEEIILFGSKARGDAHEDSDIDLLVIIREGDWRLKEEVEVLGYELSIRTYAAPSIFVYTCKEIKEMEEYESSFLESVYAEGRPVQ
jgi:uncharacterized protein